MFETTRSSIANIQADPDIACAFGKMTDRWTASFNIHGFRLHIDFTLILAMQLND